MWSAFILPYMEDKSLKDLMTIGETSAGNFQWAYPGPYTPATLQDPTLKNIVACETVIPSFRCPSAGLPEHQYDISSDNWHVMNRVPTSYLGCASGIVINQNTPRAMIDRDGVLYGMNHNTDEVKPLTLKKIKDGLSKTMLVGEALHDFKEQERIGGIRQQNAAGDHKDHWAIGSDDIDIHNDLSECLRLDGIPINLPRQFINENPCSRATAPNCQALQLWFSSAPHTGGINIVRCDGSVEFIADDIDTVAWKAFGSRASQELQSSGGR